VQEIQLILAIAIKLYDISTDTGNPGRWKSLHSERQNNVREASTTMYSACSAGADPYECTTPCFFYGNTVIDSHNQGGCLQQKQATRATKVQAVHFQASYMNPHIIVKSYQIVSKFFIVSARLSIG
jgi:hypothetical protein